MTSDTVDTPQLAKEIDAQLRSGLNAVEGLSLLPRGSRAPAAYEVSIHLFRARQKLEPVHLEGGRSSSSGRIEISAVLIVAPTGTPYGPTSVTIPLVDTSSWTSTGPRANLDYSELLRADGSALLVDRVMQLIGATEEAK